PHPLHTLFPYTTLFRSIDAMEAELPPLRSFILPGGGAAGASLHRARTICRRAERETVTLMRHDPVRPEVLRFLNRLSDYLFVLRSEEHTSELQSLRHLV